MQGYIVTHPDKILLALVGDNKIAVGDSAADGLQANSAFPEFQLRNLLFSVIVHINDPKSIFKLRP